MHLQKQAFFDAPVMTAETSAQWRAEPGCFPANADVLQQVEPDGFLFESGNQANRQVGTIGEKMEGRRSVVKAALSLGQLQQVEMCHDPCSGFEQIDDGPSQGCFTRINARSGQSLVGAAAVMSAKQVQLARLVQHKLTLRLMGAASFKHHPAGDGTRLRDQQRCQARRLILFMLPVLIRRCGIGCDLPRHFGFFSGWLRLFRRRGR